MIPCPHCGAENSAKKRVCFNCRKELAPTDAAKPSAPVQPAQKPEIPRPQPKTRAVANDISVPVWRRPLFFLSATLAQRAQFFRQLEHLLKAGIPMVAALSHLENQLPMHLRPMIREFSTLAQRGEPLTAGMVSYPTIFVEWEVAIMRAGELSGDIHTSAAEVANTLELEMELRRKIFSSLVYLIAVVLVAIFVGLLLRNLAGAQGINAVIAAAQRAAVEFVYVLAALILAWNGLVLWSRTRQGMTMNAALLARLPMFGPLIRNMMRARYALVLGALWNAGVPAIEAMTAAARASGNGHLVRVTEKNIGRITQGESITNIIEESHFFSPEVIYMLRTGETSGSLPASLRKVAEYVQMEVEAQAKVLPTQIYLLFFFLVAGAVAYFVISFYIGMLGPVFELIGP